MCIAELITIDFNAKKVNKIEVQQMHPRSAKYFVHHLCMPNFTLKASK